MCRVLTANLPSAIHAYYNVNNQAVKQIIFGFILGMDGYGNIDNADLTDGVNGCMEGFRTGILYAYGLAILPLTIGITVGNALNVYISSKTRSVWPGLFTAVLWGVWTLCSAGGMTNNILFQ